MTKRALVNVTLSVPKALHEQMINFKAMKEENFESISWSLLFCKTVKEYMEKNKSAH